MSKYLPKIEHRTKFQGDDVVAVLEPLERGQFIQVSTALDKAQKLRQMIQTASAKAEQPDRTQVDSMVAEVSATSIEVLTRNLVSITGVKDNDGNAVTKEVILSKVFFMELVNELFDRLAGSAVLGEASSVASEAK